MDPEPPTITETDGRAYVDKLLELLGTGAPRWLDNRLAEWRAADLDFQRNGYGATTRAPKHPLIAPIGEYRRWALGTMPRDEVVQLMEAAAAVNGFEMDWRGHEPWLAARLRDENGCRQALFELRTGLYFQALGHRVQYLSPQQLPGPDLSVEQVGTDVLIECVQMDASSGHQIPQTAAHEIGRQLVRFMHRSGHNRLVGLRCKKRLDPADTDVIVREVKAIIARSTTGVFEIFNGKYRIELMYGGVANCTAGFSGAARTR